MKIIEEVRYLVRVLLINPPLKTQLQGIVFTGLCEPIGLLSIATVLEKNGIETDVIDGVASGLKHKDLGSRVEEFKPDIVGIGSMMTETCSDSMEAVKIAKQAAPEAKVVIGGHNASFVADKLIANLPELDYVVVGEGEHTFLELIHSIENNGDVGRIKGVMCRNNGKPFFAGPREAIQNLDELPIPARHLIKNARYGKLSEKNTGYKIAFKNLAGMVTTRGCPFGCIFCSCTAFSGRKIRARSPKKVVDEIEYLVNERGVTQIFIADDNFTAIPRHVMEICGLIKERKIKVHWFCEGRVDTASEKMYKAMADAGCWLIFFGLESGSQRILDYYQKKTTVEKNKQAVALAQKAKLDVVGSVITGAPIETEEDFQKTLDFILHTDIDTLNMNTLKVLPGTELWRRFEASGAIKPEDWNRYFEIFDVCDAHSKEQVRGWMKTANDRFYKRPRYLAKELGRTFGRRKGLVLTLVKNLL